MAFRFAKIFQTVSRSDLTRGLNVGKLGLDHRIHSVGNLLGARYEAYY